MRELPTGTVTFLFTDIEGSTRLLHELGAEAYAEALAEHRRLLREAFAATAASRWTRRATRSSTPSRPRRSAVAAAARPSMRSPAGPIRVRMGLHTGTPHLTEEGYVGEDVHSARADRRRRPRRPGGALGGDARAGRRRACTDLGEHRLKDFAEPVSIFQLGDGALPAAEDDLEHEPAAAGVARSSAASASWSEVLALVRDGARLVTLTGPGGTGKTRLAIEAAAELVAEFKAGVFWVGLATLRDPALVARDDRADARAPRTAWPSTSASESCCSCSTTSSR